MPRAVNGTIHKNRRRRILKDAKGFRGARSKLYRTAKSAVMKAGQWAYRDRRAKKRDFRKLWIIRINAAARENGLSYSVFMNSLKKLGIHMDRKSLAELAFNDREVFNSLVEKIKVAG
ncbi:50S ribosomal protein L20 [Leptospira interrogans]|uniref:Large ribosomal subunit protein bL20 n=16 Tax=Leptospira interrogans TaxID=173 RepID=RL20_LEPIN|nr:MULTISPECIES: 50S ribosomal protein L20 [Leptospira]Q72PL0.1 RecName: Full=Large ribosomal subunit protein bL20; AltName: Full=50S ribosomal protein L20 [Leptospira interrogans serovar Copenhageni str. Fiocruz L1-130]Q8F6Q7.1 RecName: Full=Large ribosomal subunit protein bL20; AltName: Full=50S ribosomal protein L20 [Leptospira interrogans serovar Lai str. 56601]APH42262.1 50S ribosomal protein L20 [Leptospira interrogans serovar Copenhageni/Icterohaemorrhagiae]EMF42375.1 ribosomal protein L